MRRLLLLSFTFPPDNMAAAARPGQLYDYLPDHGYRAVVFAAGSGTTAPTRPDVHRVSESGAPAIATALSKLTGGFARVGAPYNDRLTWVPPVVAAVQQHLKAEPVDAIYSTSPFLAAHVAALWLKKRFRLPWIADFQDPIRDNPFRTRNWFYPYDAMLETMLFRNADRLIANTDTVADAWRNRYPQWAAKMSVLWNSFDPREAVETKPRPNRPHRLLAHVGSLYGSRHPGHLLASLERLAIDPKIVQVKLVGPIGEATLSQHGALMERMRALGILAYDNRLVSREEAMQATAEADYLLLLDINERNASFQVPSKLVDYIRFAKPILAYTAQNSPVERILARSGIPYMAIDPSLPAAVADEKVAAFLRLPLDGGGASPWFEDTFSARTEARTVSELLNDLLHISPTVAVVAEFRGVGNTVSRSCIR